MSNFTNHTYISTWKQIKQQCVLRTLTKTRFGMF